MAKNDNLNISIFAALKVSERSGVPVLLMGSPGCGKTTGVYMFAEIRGYNVVMLRGNSESHESVVGYDIAPKEATYDKPMAAIHLRPSWFEEVLRHSAKGEKTLLFLDEITTASEYVQSALLHLIFDRRCGNEPLPEDTLIVAAGNYAGNLSSAMNMLPPVLNRFMIYNVIPDHNDLEIFLNRYAGSGVFGKPTDYFATLKDQMSKLDESGTIYPVETRNRIGEVVEKLLLETTKMLIKSDKVLDLTVTDLSDIYSKSEETGGELLNFVTPRVLNYAREVTIAYFECFGPGGLKGSNYRQSMKGLLGLGLTKDPKNNSTVSNVVYGKYVDTIVQGISEIVRYTSSDLSSHVDPITQIITSSGSKFKSEEIIALTEKIEAMKRDGAIKDVPKPLSVDTIMLGIGKATTWASSSCKLDGSLAANLSDAKNIDVAKINKIINNWNISVGLINSLMELLQDPRRNYLPKEIEQVTQTYDKKISPIHHRMKSLRVMIQQANSDNSAIDSLLLKVTDYNDKVAKK